MARKSRSLVYVPRPSIPMQTESTRESTGEGYAGPLWARIPFIISNVPVQVKVTFALSATFTGKCSQRKELLIPAYYRKKRRRENVKRAAPGNDFLGTCHFLTHPVQPPAIFAPTVLPKASVVREFPFRPSRACYPWQGKM